MRDIFSDGTRVAPAAYKPTWPAQGGMRLFTLVPLAYASDYNYRLTQGNVVVEHTEVTGGEIIHVRMTTTDWATAPLRI